LMQRVEPKAIQALLDASAPAAVDAPPGSPPRAVYVDSRAALDAEPLAEQCSIDDFSKIDLRVARVIQAEAVPQANKLLRLTVSLGGDEVRTVFAGIKSAYTPEQLLGRLVVVVANLKPREMKCGTSQGMVVAAGPGGSDTFLLKPDEGAVPGQRVR